MVEIRNGFYHSGNSHAKIGHSLTVSVIQPIGKIGILVENEQGSEIESRNGSEALTEGESLLQRQADPIEGGIGISSFLVRKPKIHALGLRAEGSQMVGCPLHQIGVFFLGGSQREKGERMLIDFKVLHTDLP
jgi:hypothetical protein